MGGQRRSQRRLSAGHDGPGHRREAPDKPDPIAISAYYLSASRPGPATIATLVLRDGGRVATVAADLGQDGTDRITALATYGDLSGLPDDVSTGYLSWVP